MINNKNNLITFIITSLETAVTNNLKEFIIIRPCQILKVDQFNENHIKEISNKTVHN